MDGGQAAVQQTIKQKQGYNLIANLAGVLTTTLQCIDTLMLPQRAAAASVKGTRRPTWCSCLICFHWGINATCAALGKSSSRSGAGAADLLSTCNATGPIPAAAPLLLLSPDAAAAPQQAIDLASSAMLLRCSCITGCKSTWSSRRVPHGVCHQHLVHFSHNGSLETSSQTTPVCSPQKLNASSNARTHAAYQVPKFAFAHRLHVDVKNTGCLKQAALGRAGPPAPTTLY